MIFILHYILMNVGLPAVLILITLFLRTHSVASLTEIGVLLMVLPFVGILTKPLFCALADRHQAHKHYLMCALAVMALGYGSLTVAPFFPEFSQQHGRLVWYLDILGIVVGYSAFGIVWSLGDAMAVNGAQMAGVSWGSYRLWAVISWGVFGSITSLVNETPLLPRYVPGLLILAVSLFIEIILLGVWPNKYFVMCGTLDKGATQQSGNAAVTQRANTGGDKDDDNEEDLARKFGSISAAATKLGTIGSMSAGGGSLRGTNPRMMGAVANILMEDLGGSLRSRLGSRKTRKGLDELMMHQSGGESPAAPAAVDSGGARVQHGAADIAHAQEPKKVTTPVQAEETTTTEQSSQDNQLLVLKLIVRRDKTILKYLILFTLFGFLMNLHIAYFYMHIEQLCRAKGDNFALVTGGMMMSHAVSEVISFLLVAWFVERTGRTGALMSCALLYLIRSIYYGLLLEHLPTYLGIPFEACHGLAYGIVYTLVCAIACECVDQVDEFLPELKARKLVPEHTRPEDLKAPLRATMQGVFSGAYDGLGVGLGALFGGVYLDSHPFASLWQLAAIVCAAIMLAYPLLEWRARATMRGKAASAAAKAAASVQQ